MYTKRALSLHFPRDCIRHVTGSSDHLIGQEEQRWGYRDPELLGGLEVDGQVILQGQLHGQLCRLGPLQDLTDQVPGALGQGRTAIENVARW